MPIQHDFKDKVAVVTGASRGIGRATAELFAQSGAHTVFVSRSGADQAVEDLNKSGCSAVSFRTDVSDETQVREMIGAVIGRYDRIDVLVNNAGINQLGQIEEITLEDWNRVLATNLTSQFLCCKHVIPVMKHQAAGKIVNVSSISGRSRSVVSGVHYVTSKAGVIGLTRQLAYEVARFNINVNAVCPSQTYTPMLSDTVPHEEQERLAASVPLGRLASAEEQANVILFLASDAASYLTGAILDVNGGLL